MVRLAEPRDLEAILNCYAAARCYMRENGNPTQWGDTYPARSLLEEDLACRRLFVCEDARGVYGAFVLLIGEEPTYAVIEDGAWLDPSPYGTIHRVCGGAGRGVFSECVAFCKGQIAHLRIDTHQNNRTMRHLIEKSGFVPCGTIYVEDGSPRIAYEMTAP